MCDLPKLNDPRLLVGFESADDAAVYLLNENEAMIQTLDFFTPIVDDAYMFGQIAAANALSDVYAMGGKPILALNIVGFPTCLDASILKAILKGGADKVSEAGALLVGGHSIEDHEPKYGLSVTGLVNPNSIWKNDSLCEQDVLILTKPLGVGILTTAIKEDLVSEASAQKAYESMMTLNKYARDVLVNFPVTACTDITGFGLLGHVSEMVASKNLTVEIYTANIPLLGQAIEMAEMGIIPGGAYRNRAHIEPYVMCESHVTEAMVDILYDPQTSGGLLAAVPEKYADLALAALHASGIAEASIIAKVTGTATATHAIYIK